LGFGVEGSSRRVIRFDSADDFRSKPSYVDGVRFEPTELTPAESELQSDVRRLLDEMLPVGSYNPGLGMAAGASKELSRALGSRGLLGMALPTRYGGSDRSAVERFIVTEELLRRGAPVEYHWVGDRQSGPVINRFGTEEQKLRFLPGICSGELAFCIGMSEPDAGSDLASVVTKATKVDGGWQLNGTKIWTSGAHFSNFAITLCRTSEHADRHDGLSQLIVDLSSPGVTISPIEFIDGTADFNEVVFDSVLVPDDSLLGIEGEGWAQSASELSFERAGPERWLSPFLVVEHFIREYGPQLGAGATSFLGDAVARWWALRQVSLSVARMIDQGGSPSVHAAMGKDLGTRFEQEVMARIQILVDMEPSMDAAGLFGRLLARAILVAPSWTIRGGTNEILRGIIARGLR
jgi:3-oxocholest-4-en-26-oyl-CoA dehydrogenase alpha subunit